MKANSLSIRHFVNDPEAMERELLLKFFRFEGNRANVLQLEHIPAVLTAGCVVLCLKGGLSLKLNEQVYSIKSNDLCVIFPNTMVQTLTRSEDMDCIVLASDLEFIRNFPVTHASMLYLMISKMPCVALSDREKKIMLAHFDYIRMNYERKDFPYRIDVTRQLLLVLCHEIAAIYQNGEQAAIPSDTYQEKLFRRFIRLVTEHYEQERRVDFYAEKLCITSKYLSQVIKKLSQKTAAQWIDDFVVRRAKLMLLSSPLTVQQVSDRLNFPNPSFFTQYFRRKTGKTPKEFRLTVQ
ncbi:transcriptional regulator, AraC family [Tannerella forsythia KS16]|jgi:AraC-type DNA-binding domain-containing proteins|nr:AraC family transcriptional regulator [Tannerella forsythia]KKY62062.1 hypothetical protein Tanf_04440 [Tannerella forsythia]OLQ21584.1 hypothetical protein BGK60_07425 [Tannerella forsythia]PDP43842.1 AraC family transcriptional regulator [Tannerella forsythia]PDP70129.1 AraC family transcriptional regulator [Tannerella forsythia]TPE15486.1 helix-turn-helix domain-containing protein [Tannerella forsythia]